MALALSLLLVVTLIVLVVLHTYLKVKDLPPGPWGLPIVGSLFLLFPDRPHLILTRLAEKYGPIYSIKLGKVNTVVLTDPGTIKTFFAKDGTAGRAPLYLTHGIMRGYGLICAEGALWKDQRRFVHSWLRTVGGTKTGPQKSKMDGLILRHVQDFVDHMKTIQEAIDPLEPLRHHLGSMINELVFGRCWLRTDERWQWLQQLQEEGTKMIGVAGPLNFLPFLRILPNFKRTMSYLIDGQRQTHQFYRELIREEMEKIPANSESDDSVPTNLIRAFLNERIKKRDSANGRFYDDEQFHHLLADIFGAGLDTTLASLRWLLLFLALNRQFQRKLKEEIDLVLLDMVPTSDLIGSMPFTEACIAETQRIRSVVPLGIPHGTLEEIRLEKYVIPKGTMVVPLQWAVHMDPRQFPNPHQFDPNRFLDSKGQFRKPSHFMPFQNGKRACVGDHLAKMIMFAFCVSIFKNFDLELPNGKKIDTEGECGITLTPKPHKLYFKSID